MFFTLVYSEVNLMLVPSNTWWLDSGATTNISVSMKGCLNYRKPIDSERWIYVGDGKSVEVEAIGNFRLLLCIGFYMDLKDIFVVSSFRRNLISVSYLDKSGYSSSFGNNEFSLSINSNIVGTGSLLAYYNMYLLDTVATYNETLNTESQGTKRKIDNTSSRALWHRCLGHISKNRVKQLMSNGILESIDFTNLVFVLNALRANRPKQRD